MEWDDELSELIDRVRKTFDGLAVAEAYLRALSGPLPAPTVELADQDLPRELRPRRTLTFVHGQDQVRAFKAELRRVLTNH